RFQPKPSNLFKFPGKIIALARVNFTLNIHVGLWRPRRQPPITTGPRSVLILCRYSHRPRSSPPQAPHGPDKPLSDPLAANRIRTNLQQVEQGIAADSFGVAIDRAPGPA